MFALFEDGSNYATGYSDTIPAFTTGIVLENADKLTKQVESTYWVDENDENGNQWYVDKNGVLTTEQKNNKPLKRKVVVNETIDFVRYPQQFNKIEIMKFKKEQLLNDSNFDDCMMYEFNMDNFMDVENSTNVDLGRSDVKIKVGGMARTCAIKIAGATALTIIYEASDDLELHYSFDGKTFSKNKKNIKNADNNTTLYVLFKNSIDKDIVLYNYQILFKK